MFIYNAPAKGKYAFLAWLLFSIKYIFLKELRYFITLKCIKQETSCKKMEVITETIFKEVRDTFIWGEILFIILHLM